MSRTATLVFLAGLLALNGMAIGQLVTPPTKAPEPTPPFELPPPPPPSVNPTGEVPPPAVNFQPPVKPTEPELSKHEYVSLVKKDAQGRLIPLSEPADYAALKNNPTLNNEIRAKLSGILAERKATFERLVTDNIDLVEQLEGGLIERSDLTNKPELSRVTAATKPITPPAAPAGLSTELRKREALTSDQARWNQKIAQEYTKEAVMAGKPIDASQGDNASKVQAIGPRIQAALRQGIEEPLWHYRNLLVDASSRIAEAGNAAGFDTQTVKKMVSAAGKMDTTSAKIEGVKKAMEDLSVEQRKEFLRKVVELRDGKK